MTVKKVAYVAHYYTKVLKFHHGNLVFISCNFRVNGLIT